jgi:hypothetical protein
MRKFMVAGMLAGLLSLAGCGANGQLINPFTGNTVSLDTTAIQQAAVNACNFEPTAAGIANVVAASNSTLTTIDAVVQLICGAVKAQTSTTASSKLGAAMPNSVEVYVNGQAVKVDRQK